MWFKNRAFHTSTANRCDLNQQMFVTLKVPVTKACALWLQCCPSMGSGCSHQAPSTCTKGERAAPVGASAAAARAHSSRRPLSQCRSCVVTRWRARGAQYSGNTATAGATRVYACVVGVHVMVYVHRRGRDKFKLQSDAWICVLTLRPAVLTGKHML